jgi:putative transposase
MEFKQADKKYKSDHTVVYSCQYHVIFCPKYRRKVLTNGIDTRLKELILEKQAEYGYEIIDMEVMPDHVHLLIDCAPSPGIDKIVGKIKGYTSHTIRKEFPWMKRRLPSLWTRSKFISTTGAVTMQAVQSYIANQKGK